MKAELGLGALIALAACHGELTVTDIHEDVEAGVRSLQGADLDNELARSPVREAPESFARLGLIWDGDRPAAFEVATSADGALWSAWTTPTLHHVELEETGSFVGQLDLLGEAARYYRFRGVPGASASYLRVEFLVTTHSESVEDGDSGAGVPKSRTLGNVAVYTRSDWGARNPQCSSNLGGAYRATIHHTDTPTNDSSSPEARLRQIQSYHIDVKGWCDIGYHYLISRDGRIWEGRPDSLMGAHTGGANSGNIGIAVMGTYDSTQLTSTQFEQLVGLVSALGEAHGIDLTRSRIKGHSEYKSTSCPGDAIRATLDDIVAAADEGGGTPPPPPPPPPSGDCSLPSDGPWSCGGLTGNTTNPDGVYYTTSFGCWVDEYGNSHGDAGDNCLPACSLSSIGCSGMSGPACERHLNWYSADSDRFGCGTRIKVTEPDSGRSAILIAIDRGPNCTIERIVDHYVLDMSYRASYYLFGEPTSASERADVLVEVVDPSTPLGPHDGSAVCYGGSDGPPPPPPPPPAGETVTVIGVIYAGSDTSARLGNATVTLDGRTTTTALDGLWYFDDVPEGSFTVTASKSGFQTRTITGTTYAAWTWSSFGLSPTGASAGDAILQGVVYWGGVSSNRIPYASITLSTGHTATADANGFYKLYDLPAGPVTITAHAPGYSQDWVPRWLIDGETAWGSVELTQQ